MAQCELQQGATMNINADPAAASLALGAWTSATPSCAQFDMRLM